MSEFKRRLYAAVERRTETPVAVTNAMTVTEMRRCSDDRNGEPTRFTGYPVEMASEIDSQQIGMELDSLLAA